MTRKYEIKKKIVEYLKQHNLNYQLINDDKKPKVISDLDTIYLHFDNLERVLGRCAEGDIHLRDECMYVRAYYNKGVSDVVRDASCYVKSDLLEVLNFINAECFFTSLYTPRIYLSQDGFNDIAINTVIPYGFYELAPIETMEYITAFLPDFLEQFGIPIIMCILGEMTKKEATLYIRREFLLEEDAKVEWIGDD